MGLDMYLSKRTYVGANFEHNKVLGQINLTKGEDKKPINIRLNRVDSIIEQVGYWRKANAIHKWFVEEVQEGKDDCKEYYVSKENLKTLIQLCEKDIKYFKTAYSEKTEGYKVFPDVQEGDLELPSQSGFFFGSTEYNEYHVKNLQETIDMLKPLLLEEDGEFYYQSSW